MIELFLRVVLSVCDYCFWYTKRHFTFVENEETDKFKHVQGGKIMDKHTQCSIMKSILSKLLTLRDRKKLEGAAIVLKKNNLHEAYFAALLTDEDMEAILHARSELATMSEEVHSMEEAQGGIRNVVR